LISYVLKKKLNTKGELLKLLDLLENEADVPPFFYTTDNIAASLKTSVPRMSYIFEKLKEKEYEVAKTHFSPIGFKTNAPKDQIEEIFKQRR